MEKFVRAWDNKNSRMVHIRELPKDTRNGKKCDCRCVEESCKGALEACQGDVNEWFFRHQFKTNCKGGPMTALHILAQELLTGNHSVTTRKGDVVYSNGEYEWLMIGSRYRADVAGTKADGSRFLIEIFVTHKLAEEANKVTYIREQKIHAIEIDLSDVDPNIERSELLMLLLTDVAKQREIYSPNPIEIQNSQSEGKSKPANANVKKESGPSLMQILLIVGGAIWMVSRIKSFFKRKRK